MGASCLPPKLVHGLPVSPLWNVCKGCTLGPCSLLLSGVSML